MFIRFNLMLLLIFISSFCVAQTHTVVQIEKWIKEIKTDSLKSGCVYPSDYISDTTEINGKKYRDSQLLCLGLTISYAALSFRIPIVEDPTITTYVTHYYFYDKKLIYVEIVATKGGKSKIIKQIYFKAPPASVKFDKNYEEIDRAKYILLHSEAFLILDHGKKVPLTEENKRRITKIVKAAKFIITQSLYQSGWDNNQLNMFDWFKIK